MMFDYRLQLKEYDRRGIAPFGEGCALFAALSSFVFVFCIGFNSSAYGSFDLYSAFSLKSAGAGFGIAAALIAILSVSALFALTVLRYIRFLTGKSQKDSVYFCYATVFCYLAGIMLFSECAAQGTYRLNGATVAGLILAGAGVLASVILFGIAGRKMHGREAKSRYPFFAVSLGILLMLFALFSLGMVTTEERLGLIFLFPEETLPENGTLAVFAFLFLIGFAANAVLARRTAPRRTCSTAKTRSCARRTHGGLCHRLRSVPNVPRPRTRRHDAPLLLGRSRICHAACRASFYLHACSTVITMNWAKTLRLIRARVFVREYFSFGNILSPPLTIYCNML